MVSASNPNRAYFASVGEVAQDARAMAFASSALGPWARMADRPMMWASTNRKVGLVAS